MSGNNKKPTVIVIGAGLGGCSAIVGLRKVDKDVAIVLVEPKDYAEVFWATYRSPFEKWVREGSVMELAGWAAKHNVRHIRSTVTNLTETTVELANGETVEYTVCVVATGAATRAPFLGRGVDGVPTTRAERLAQLEQYGKQYLNADSVLICGGGLIGTELSGDIAGYAKKAGKNTKVTLVHSGPYLSHVEISEKASKMIQRKLEKIGVTIILNDKVIQNGGKLKLHSSGKELHAQQVIYTTGLVAINDFLKPVFADGLTDEGWIATDEFFRIKTKAGKGRLFAIGDCSTFLPNAGYQNLDNAKTIGKNIKVTLDSLSNQKGVPDDKALTKGKVSGQTTASTVGPKDGVFYTPSFYTQFMFPALKNKTMFLFRPRMELGFPKK